MVWFGTGYLYNRRMQKAKSNGQTLLKTPTLAPERALNEHNSHDKRHLVLHSSTSY